MKQKPKYTCPVCGRKHYRFIDMEQCAEIDSKKMQKELTTK